MTYDTATPRIAVYLLIEKDQKFAFLLRSNTGWRDGYFALPAGRVEKNESFTQAAIREGAEEVGIIIEANNLRHVMTSHRLEDRSDWVDLIFVVEQWSGEVVNNEPHVHGELKWFALNELPENITPSQKAALKEYLKGKQFCEIGWN